MRRQPCHSPLRLLSLAAVLLLAAVPLFSQPDSSNGSGGSLPAVLSAGATKLADCCCDMETIDVGNDDILYKRLQKLRTYTFFRIFRVDLHSDCPFWHDNPQCSRRNCAVCDECDEIPASPFTSSSNAISSGSGNPGGDGFGSFYSSGGGDSLSSVDRTLMNGFHGWSDTDECQWIAPEDSETGSAVYINLQLNPEGYTGYEGEEAHRIWRAIYEQNCFNARINTGGDGELNHPDDGQMQPAQGFPPASDGLMRPSPSSNNAGGVVTAVDFSNLCLEQRVFYRLVSGLHASISCHIANAFPVAADVDPYIDLHAPEHCALIGPNLSEWQRRVGAHPDRLTNLYFTFVFLLRAVNKAQDTLRHFNYSAGVPGKEHEDVELQQLMHNTLASPLVSQCSSDASFDEASMFASERGPYLKKQLRAAFRNISRIIDCVGCEKCRLHGKLQILGLGTALRLMFQDAEAPPVKLVRNEVMALIVTLAKLSHALHITRDMQARIEAGAAATLAAPSSTAALQITKEDAGAIGDGEDSTGEAVAALPKMLPPSTLGPLLLGILLVVLTSTVVALRWLWTRRGPGGTVARRGSLSTRHARRTKGVENGHTAMAAAATAAHAATQHNAADGRPTDGVPRAR